MKKLQGHQGDVQFRQVDAIPAMALKVDNKPIAYGEHSGHQHVLTGDVQLFEFEGKIIAAVGIDGARLQHCHESDFNPKCWTSREEIKVADHASHLLPEGVYEFFIQNSYNPYAKIMEKVVD